MKLRSSLLISALRNTHWTYYMRWIYFQNAKIWICLLEMEANQRLVEFLQTGWQKLRNLGRSPNSFTGFLCAHWPTRLCFVSPRFLSVCGDNSGWRRPGSMENISTASHHSIMEGQEELPWFFFFNIEKNLFLGGDKLYIFQSCVMALWSNTATCTVSSLSFINAFRKVPGI